MSLGQGRFIIVNPAKIIIPKQAGITTSGPDPGFPLRATNAITSTKWATPKTKEPMYPQCLLSKTPINKAIKMKMEG
jgi:hypothetical protein